MRNTPRASFFRLIPCFLPSAVFILVLNNNNLIGQLRDALLLPLLLLLLLDFLVVMQLVYIHCVHGEYIITAQTFASNNIPTPHLLTNGRPAPRL